MGSTAQLKRNHSYPEMRQTFRQNKNDISNKYRDTRAIYQGHEGNEESYVILNKRKDFQATAKRDKDFKNK